MTDDEVYTRLLYFGRVQLGFTEEETWLTPIGELLDYMACHRQWHGLEKPYTDPFEDLTLNNVLAV